MQLNLNNLVNNPERQPVHFIDGTLWVNSGFGLAEPVDSDDLVSSAPASLDKAMELSHK
jgi:hypothetical protein